MNYAFRGARSAAGANRRRKNAQQQTQMYSQFAPQRFGQMEQLRDINARQINDAQNQQDQKFRFGINALTGLMR